VTAEENSYPGLIDTHVHLNELDDPEKVILRARSAGVRRIVAVGMDLASNRKTLQLAEKYSDTVAAAIGYHPWMIREEAVDETLSFIEDHLEGCFALGEVGLDYKVKVRKGLQRLVFAHLLQIAAKKNKPVNIHSRLSYERTHRMVCEAGIRKAVFHWYSGPPEVLNRILSDGYYVSATPALAYSRYHRASIESAPIKRILIETDAPQEYEGIPSEPAHLLNALKLLAQLKQIPETEAARITSENAMQFYGLVAPAAALLNTER